MDKVQEATTRFIDVRNALSEPAFMSEYRSAHFKPLRFYMEHSKEEAIKILMEEKKI